MAQARAMSKGYHATMNRGGKLDIAMPPEGYVPHPELAASVDVQIANQKQVESYSAEIDHANKPVREHESQQDSSAEQSSGLFVQHEEEQPIEEVTEQVEQEVQAESTSSTAPKRVGKSIQENMRELREEKERIARERDEIRMQNIELRQAQQYQQQLQQQQFQQQQPKEIEEQFQFDMDEDSLVEGKQLKKVSQDIYELRKAYKAQQRELENYKKQSYDAALEGKLKSEHADWNDVWNQQNLNDFERLYPEDVKSISMIPDDYRKAKAAYAMMKSLGLSSKKTVEQKTYEEEKAKATANTAKPRTLTSQGNTPLSRANAFANDRKLDSTMKERLIKEMDEARRRS